MGFTAKIFRGEDGWYVAQCAELPGCVTQGRTIREAKANFAEALELYLETLAELRDRPASTRMSSHHGVVTRTARFEIAPA
ncbi:MAG: type II toxin-antitoxin system HicB family antitoxin [Thermoplasmata archaeon]|nr:type II toxin-antitoxin system HicB family antitoxin [Thermoplasmata archaeon]